MGTIIAAIIPLALMIYSLIYLSFSMKKKKSIETDVKIGYRCYNCSKETTDEGFHEYFYKNVFSGDDIKEDLKTCKKCTRDIKLAKIVDNKPKTWISSFRKIIFTKRNYNRLIYGIFSIYVLFMIAYFLSIYFDNKMVILQYIYNFLLTLYWLILFYKLRISYIKNPS